MLRRRRRAYVVFGFSSVPDTITSPPSPSSTAEQIGTRCGSPFGRTVASRPTRAAATRRRISSSLTGGRYRRRVVAGLLLTGGSSRRMGRDKAELVVAGERLADHAARELTGACEPVLEIRPGRSELEAVADDEPRAGPLAALVTGARALRPRRYQGAVLLLAG